MAASRTVPTQNKKQVYVNGSVATQLNTAPLKRPQDDSQQLQRVRERQAVALNKEKAKQLNAGYLFFLTFMTIGLFVVLSYYVQLRGQADTRMHQIARLESEVAELKLDNDTRYMRAQAKVPLSQIRQRAAAELGMIFPTEAQTVYYDLNESDYMEQYQDIPDSGTDTLFGKFFGR